MALGAFGPWAQVLSLSVSGVDNSAGDGWLVILLAALVLLCVLGQHRSSALVVIGCLASLGGLAVTVYDRNDITSAIDGAGAFGGVASVGWGLNLALAASLSAAVQAVVAAKATTVQRQWKATPAERNVLVGPDGGLNIPHKTALFEYNPRTEPELTVPKPGWYVDPDDSQRLRYWNGDGWDDATARLEPDPANH
jgi:hypothetical protein